MCGHAPIEVENGEIRTTVRSSRAGTSPIWLGLVFGLVVFVGALRWMPRHLALLPVDVLLGIFAGRVFARVLEAIVERERTLVLARSGVRIDDRALTFEAALLETRKDRLPGDVRVLLELAAARAKAKLGWIPLEDVRAMQRFLHGDGLRGAMEVAAWGMADRGATPDDAGPSLTLTVTKGVVSRGELAGATDAYAAPNAIEPAASDVTYVVPTRFVNDPSRGRAHLDARLDRARRTASPES